MWGTPCGSSESPSQLVSPLNSTAHLHPGVGGRMRHPEPSQSEVGRAVGTESAPAGRGPGSPCLLRTRECRLDRERLWAVATEAPGVSRGEEAFVPVSWLRHGVSRRHSPRCCVAWGRFQDLPEPLTSSAARCVGHCRRWS